ncbi:MAG: hypothetical protein SCM96_15865 [Acidobacteriota bacterium]|nr:hypothetical protein [Acidobacteriota bacterium]
MNRAAINNLQRILNDAGIGVLNDPLRVEGWLSDYGRGCLKLENFALA